MSLVGQLTIDLECLSNNWAILSRRASELKAPTVSVDVDSAVVDGNSVDKKYCEAAAVVKADAYGLGVIPVARALYKKGCRTFFVANIHEALELNRALPTQRVIYTFQGFASGEEACFIEHNIQPVLTSISMLKAWQSSSVSSSFPCAIKINTGMNRLGLSESDYACLVCHDKILSRLNVSLVMSHLACADQPDHPLNQIQLKCFERVVDLSKKEGIPSTRFSLANSAGIFLGRKYLFDMVRPGIALYSGALGNLDLEALSELKAVASLVLPILDIRKTLAGDSIGYGADYVLEEDSYIATVGGGYSDGLFRSMSSEASFVYQGRSVPVVGRVSMDSFALNLGTEAPGLMRGENDADVQNIVTVFNDKSSLIAFALACNTISYEVLTSLGARYQRSYLNSELKVESDV